MNSQFSHGPVYAPIQSLDNRQSLSSPPISYNIGPQIQHSTLGPANALPSPILQPCIPPFDNQPLAFRNSASQTPLIAGPPLLSTAGGLYQPVPSHGLPDFNFSHSTVVVPQRRCSASLGYNSQEFQSYSPIIPSQGNLPDLQPISAGGVAEQRLSTPRPAPALLASHSTEVQNPIHVVGSQGRRGTLPSSTGRPTAITGASLTSDTSTSIPSKDAEGKFPCLHCAKTYLHAKHLKRHLLRHSGTRPYSCGLCRDTFSRSDILKRHFQKCSVRRGNPTGESHLSHSRATKKSKELAEGLSRTETPMLCQSRPAAPPQPSLVTDFSNANVQNNFDLGSVGLGSSAFSEESQTPSTQGSRSNGVKHPGNLALAGLSSNIGASSPSSYDPSSLSFSTESITPDSATTSGEATPYQFSTEAMFNHLSHNPRPPPCGNNGVRVEMGYAKEPMPQIVGSSHGRGNDLVDWSALLASNGQIGYSSPQLQSSMHAAYPPSKVAPSLVGVPFALPQNCPPSLSTQV